MLSFSDRQVKIAEGTHVMVTNVKGAVDGSTVRIFEEKLLTYLKEGISRLIINFSEVQYINSTGMGLLVKIVDKFKADGGDIHLVAVPKKVLALFDLLGLLSLIKIGKSEEEALELLTEGIAAQQQEAPAAPSRGTPAQRQSPAASRQAAAAARQSPAAARQSPAAPRQSPAVPRQSPVAPRQAASSPRQAAQASLNATSKSSTAPASKPSARPQRGALAKGKRKAVGKRSKQLVIRCLNCKGQISLGRVLRAGTFKCPKCFTIFRIFKNRQIRFYKKKVKKK